MTKILGERIAIQRISLGLTKVELEKACGMSAGNVTRWERGKAYPTSYSLKKLCEVLHCSADWLLGLKNG